MKKLWVILLSAILLAGCSKEQTLETVSDVHVTPTAAVMQQILVQLPPELSAPALQDEETGALYLCDDYCVTVQTVTAGDLERTIRNATGMEKEELQIMQTQQGNMQRYQWVWAANGENGIQVGRGCVLDDGSYHYVLTALAEESNMKKIQPVWAEMFASFRVVSGEKISSGS